MGMTVAVAVTLLSWNVSHADDSPGSVAHAPAMAEGEWLSYDRTLAGQRHSPLSDLNEQTVGKLGLAWSIDLDNNRGLEATPLYSDGVLYTSLSWSRVMAVDATSGEILWSFDPKVDKAKGH